MVHGSDRQLNVVVVDASESLLEIDGDRVGEAGGEPEHPPLASLSELRNDHEYLLLTRFFRTYAGWR
jgi:hypothetical protein